MSDDNKRNLLFFESPSVRELYSKMDAWQDINRKRLHSITIQKEGDTYCCIALTNPTEVMIVGSGGRGTVRVNDDRLMVETGKPDPRY